MRVKVTLKSIHEYFFMDSYSSCREVTEEFYEDVKYKISDNIPIELKGLLVKLVNTEYGDEHEELYNKIISFLSN